TYMNHPVGQECQAKEKKLMEMSVGSFAEGMQDGTIKGVKNPMMGAIATMIVHRGLYQFLLDDKGRMLQAMGVEQDSVVEFMRNLLYKGLDVDLEKLLIDDT
ncbi:MAG: hypothetical protein ABUK01_16655, partial [Leptospirales bacterium]